MVRWWNWMARVGWRLGWVSCSSVRVFLASRFRLQRAAGRWAPRG